MPAEPARVLPFPAPREPEPGDGEGPPVLPPGWRCGECDAERAWLIAESGEVYCSRCGTMAEDVRAVEVNP